MKEKVIKKITQKGKYSYVLPILKSEMKKLKFRERQKVEMIFDYKKQQILIRDYKPKKK